MSAPTPSQSRPSDDAILLAMLLGHDRALCADEVAGSLRQFGFELGAQQVASMLRRLARLDLAPVAIRPMRWAPSYKVYELTPCGDTQIGNRWPSLRPLMKERREEWVLADLVDDGEEG